MTFSRVFVPHSLVTASSGSSALLVGHRSDAQTLFILAAIPIENAKPFANRLKYKNKSAIDELQIVGIFEHDITVGCACDAVDVQRQFQQIDDSSAPPGLVFVHLSATGAHRVVVKSLLHTSADGRIVDTGGIACDIFLVDPEDFTSRTLEILLSNVDVNDEPDRVDNRVKCPEILHQILRAKSALERHALPPFAISFFGDVHDVKKSPVANVCRSAIVVFAGALKTTFRNSGLRHLLIVASPYVNLASQTQTRFRQLESLNSESSNKDSILHWNTVFAILLDLVLGITVTWALVRFSSAEKLFDMFLENAEIVVAELQHLLKWMMGSPAGFKLNLPLNYSLGTFFLFHIYLWQEYLGMIKPALSAILQGALYTGVFGLSFQLSLLQDLVALSTFHVYCFYAYATKLYGLHVAGLAAFWRLFRGKKWNPLRHRVDSCEYDTDQLFMGTLSLTILLFLMPTTALYYVVFTTLRLVVLAAQVILHKMTALMNSAPIYLLLLYVVKSKQLISDVTVSVMPPKPMDDGTLVVAIKGTISSWERATSVFTDRIGTKDGLMLRDFIGNLITGKLICPI